MPEESIEALEGHIDAISSTVNNLQGLVEKTARIQAELSTDGLAEAAEAVAEGFSSLSSAVDRLEAVMADLRMERNRLESEG